MQGDVRFAVLGPVRGWRGEAELDLGQPQQRAVLAALLVREGAQATLEELIDDVWGEEAPATSARVIRNYVHRLRLILGRTGTGHITSVGHVLLQALLGIVPLVEANRPIAAPRAEIIRAPRAARAGGREDSLAQRRCRRASAGPVTSARPGGRYDHRSPRRWLGCGRPGPMAGSHCQD